MALTFFPFASGAGANISQAQWGQMAQFWLNTGVLSGQLNNLNVYADSTGMQVKVDIGMAWIQGFYFKSDTLVIMPISAANAANPRIDRVCLQVDWTNNNISIIVLTGIPATTPAAPAVTQNTNIWQISLAQVYVAANASTIAAGNITDERIFAKSVPYLYRNSTGGISYNTTSALQILAISGGIGTQNDLTLSGNNVNVNTAGTYAIEIDADMSGLGQNLSFELLIRVYKDGVTYNDYDHTVKGINASAGLNLDTIWGHNKITVNIQKGGYIQFYIRNGDAPRTINDYILNIVRLGD